MCESMVGLRNITCDIEKRKLYFFGKLCKTKNSYLAKQIFLQRLFSCLLDGRNHIGFIPDILNILCKYNLYEFLITYISDGNFPDKLQWKRLVVNAVESKHDNDSMADSH